MDRYCLPDDYRHRLDNSFFDDTPYKDEYQDEVYEEAKNILLNNNYSSVLDIGTGSGFKLLKYFNDYRTFGVDVEPTITFLRHQYPEKEWGNFESISGSFNLAICSDVIEHIPEPDEFIESILALDFDKIIFSTPDRNSMYGEGNLGEPSNTAHVREWTMSEFYCYLSRHFNVENQLKFHPNTQFIVCTKK
jgi:hypothetical protein